MTLMKVSFLRPFERRLIKADGPPCVRFKGSVTAPIFGKNSKLASTMTVPFHKSSDFDLHFAYKTADGCEDIH